MIRIKYVGDNIHGDLVKGEEYDADITSANVIDPKTGHLWYLSPTDFIIVNEKDESDKPQGLRSLIGQDMKSLNVEFK